MTERLPRAFSVSALLFAAVVHAIKTPYHFQIATWLGALFIVDTIGFFAVAIWMLVRPSRLSGIAAGLLGAGTAVGYVVSRTVGLPMVGKLPWDTLGVTVSVVEVIVAVIAIGSLGLHLREEAVIEQRHRRVA